MSTTTESLNYVRQYSMFAPTHTYDVAADSHGGIGAVARNDGARRWSASNRTWSGGGELAGTFRTRRDAARALQSIADGADPTVYGGYLERYSCSACRAVLVREDGPRVVSDQLSSDVVVRAQVGPWRTTDGRAECRYADDGAHAPVTY